MPLSNISHNTQHLLPTSPTYIRWTILHKQNRNGSLAVFYVLSLPRMNFYPIHSHGENFPNGRCVHAIVPIQTLPRSSNPSHERPVKQHEKNNKHTQSHSHTHTQSFNLLCTTRYGYPNSTSFSRSSTTSYFRIYTAIRVCRATVLESWSEHGMEMVTWTDFG